MIHPEVMSFIVTMLVLILAITIHEFAHALAADRLGDDTPRSQGRISINPVDHLDPLGTLMMAITTYTGFGIGWGRPVQTRPSAFRHPRRDLLLVAGAGPVSNVLQALVFAAAVRLNSAHDWLPPGSPGEALLTTGIWINLVLTFFNLIPIPPLDGSKVLSALLPIRHAENYDHFMATFGLILFGLLAFTHLATYIIEPPVAYFFSLLSGY